MDVYFSVQAFKKYGALSKRPIDDLQNQARVDILESKRDPLDFALWKAAKPGEPSWESPWGQGRPGWHIECSAMIDSLFPDRLDIHLGGSDLVFPHHENEIAQSEARHPHPLARFWLHNGMLQLNAEKMSKSLGNIIDLREFIKRYGAETLKLMCHQTLYRNPMDFSRESIVRTEALLERLYTCKQKALEAGVPPPLTKEQEEILQACVGDDLNSAKAIGIILKEAREAFKQGSPRVWLQWRSYLPFIQDVLGFLTEDPVQALANLRQRRIVRSGLSPERCREIEEKLALRQSLREAKDFAASDQIRLDLEASGIQVMDGPDGANWDVYEA
jgi:cysteinyl-tRNA synthetase